MSVSAFAPAKINLTLHVTGQRADGYHLLDSLVVFADLGDRITARPGPLALTVSGPFAGDIDTGPDNLVLRAARFAGVDAALHLEKNLPVASGIGGGSSDAAATLRVLAEMAGARWPDPVALGADVPVCMVPRAQRMRGIGEDVTQVPGLPPLAAVLVNPGVGVSTPAIFARLTRRDHAPMADIPGFADGQAFAQWVAAGRNDLQEAAISLCPVIATVLADIAAQPGVLLARMSGSGATCFGLFATRAGAEAAARAMTRPGWWVAPVTLT